VSSEDRTQVFELNVAS